MVPPAQTSPETGYTPSQTLADFVRCRDLTCRFPGCHEPAVNCDLDHTLAYADGGPTHASNLKCLCRKDHLLKTFWGWRDQQLPDGAVIWTAPTGQTYITTPGSALLFPQLSAPTADIVRPGTGDRCTQHCLDRTAMMPRRHRTRAQAHAGYVTAQRRQNQKAREARQAARAPAQRPTSYPADDPPPF